jgi:hypothetical protein
VGGEVSVVAKIWFYIVSHEKYHPMCWWKKSAAQGDSYTITVQSLPGVVLSEFLNMFLVVFQKIVKVEEHTFCTETISYHVCR